MVDKSHHKKQLEIEESWLKYRDIKPAPGKTMQELFGDADNWYLEIGPYQLMLDPYKGSWLYYDSIHEQWTDSGCQVGTVLFSLEGEDIVIETLNNAPEDTTEKQACIQCGESLSADSKFCPYCGAPVKFAKKTIVCKNCGFTVTDSRAKFCNKCGDKLE